MSEPLITIGDFFSNSATARPINARPFTFTAVSKDPKVLPGGRPNPTGKPVAAAVRAAYVFIGEKMAEARVAAREALREMFVDEKTKQPRPMTPDDWSIEYVYQMVFRCVWEYDARKREAVRPLFADVALVRSLLEFTEAQRILDGYDAYVKAEHPEVIDDATFRAAEGGSEAVAR